MSKRRAVDFRFFSVVILVLATVNFAEAQTSGSAEKRCSALTKAPLDNARVTSAVIIAAATTMPDAPLGPYTVRIMPSFCRVKITDRPTADSEIRTEVWLPLDGWTSRIRGVGNGGFAGELYYEQMAAAIKDGSVAVSTDTGHIGGGPQFALGHPEKIKDFGWRGVHDMTAQAKAITAAFYGKPAAHAYFNGCSDGGREALMEAQRFPTDYDGILAGAPAYNWTALLASSTADEQLLRSTPANDIPVSKLPAIASAVRFACDARDGLADGILNDPRQCNFDPAALICKGAESDSCLTPPQVASLKAIYADKVDTQGKKIYPGYAYGAEDAPGSWGQWILGNPSLMFFFGTGFYSDFVYNQPDWKLSSFNFHADYKLANEKTAADLNATDPNLKPFASRGGKLILYHGWDDPAIPAEGTVDYYESAMSALGERGTSSSMRLYLVPGMLHCGGGPGVNLFGEGGSAPADAQHDVFTALQAWVESGAAPGDLIASKFVDDDWSKGVGMTRPLCAYPKATKYLGGDPKDAKSFVCQNAAR